MTAFTDFLDLYLPGGGSLGIGGDDEAADIDRINQNMQKIDDWSEATDAKVVSLDTLRIRRFSGLAANIGTATGMALGDLYQETDGDKQLWTYDGTNWVTSNAGLYLIVPSAVSGTNVTKAGGRVTAAASPEIVIDGVFTSRFRRYLVKIDLDSASVAVATNLQLRAAGVTQGSGYTVQTTLNTGPTTLQTVRSAPGADAQIGPGLTTGTRQISLEVSFAASAVPTLISGTSGASDLTLSNFLVTHGVAVAITGLRIAPSTAANLTGTVSVYGMV